MIARHEQTLQSDDTPVKTIISEKIKSLDECLMKGQAQVTSCFEDLIKTLKTREKQLLRQLEAVHSQQLSVVQSKWEHVNLAPSIAVNLREFHDITDSIVKFGKIELSVKDNLIVSDAEPYKVEEYEDAKNDHVSFDKSIIYQQNASIFDFSNKIHLNDINVSSINNVSCSSSSYEDTNDFSLLNNSSSVKHKLNNGNNNYSPVCSPRASSVLPQNITQRLNTSTDHSLCSSSSDALIEKNNTTATAATLSTNDENTSTELFNNNESLGNDEHPKQIQQWLQQILIETETEPSIQESKSRFRELQLSLET